MAVSSQVHQYLTVPGNSNYICLCRFPRNYGPIPGDLPELTPPLMAVCIGDIKHHELHRKHTKNL